MPTPIRYEESVLAGHDVAAPEPDVGTMLTDTRFVMSPAELASGLVLTPSLAFDRGSLRVELSFNGIVQWSAALDQDNLCRRWSGTQGNLKGDLTFCVDLADGELTVSGDVCVQVRGSWLCQRFTDEVLFAWSPTIGAVGGIIVAHPPAVSDGRFGTSRSIVPTITRIPVDLVSRVGTSVGNIVKQTFFADVPDFLFNVCFAVGWFPIGGAGSYGDPKSPWFNVFVGYYQIDCPKPAWTRPFGYDAAGGAVRFDELLKIGKADWNYFSNWMYGVPLETIQPYDGPDPGVVCKRLGRETVGSSQWDLVDLDGFGAVSAYQSSATGAAQLLKNSVLTPVWRLTYGEPLSDAGLDTSFIGTQMHARLFLAYSEDESAFHTYIFGGTINKAFDGPDNDAFLAEQMSACREVMAASYPSLGFAP